jgi:hypothetical protein
MLERPLHVPTWKCRDLTANEVKQIGVSEQALAGDAAKGTFKVTCSRVVWGAKFFDFNPHGDPAAIFICRDEDGGVQDMAAWSPKDGRLAVWQGVVSMLGEENVLKPRLGEPLTVFSSPREWLKADREGVVLIDALAALPKLYAASPIYVASKGARSELLALWRPKIPRICLTPSR